MRDESAGKRPDRLLELAAHATASAYLDSQRVVVHVRAGTRILRLVQRFLGGEERESAPAPERRRERIEVRNLLFAQRQLPQVASELRACFPVYTHGAI